MNPFVRLLSNAKWTLPFFVAGSAILAARMSFRSGESISAFEPGPEGDVVFTGTTLGRIDVWSLADLKKIDSVNVPCQVECIGASKSGKKLIYGGKAGEIGALKFENKKLTVLKTGKLPCTEIQDVEFSENEAYCAASNLPYAKVFLMDKDLNVINSMFQPGNGVTYPFISEKNNYIAHSGQAFWVWDLNKVKNSKYKNAECHSPESEKLIAECLKAKMDGVGVTETVPFADYKRGLVVGYIAGDEGTPRTVGIWDALSNKFEPILRNQDPLVGIALSPEEKLFAVSCRSGAVRVFGLSDRKKIGETMFTADIPASQQNFTFPIERIRFVKGKPEILCMTIDSRLFLWNFKSGQIRQLG